MFLSLLLCFMLFFEFVLDVHTIFTIITTPAKKQTHSSRILFLAAETGNTKFVVELIRRYPDLIWKVNDDKLSIFHIAVKHRHEGIYNLLYEIGSMKDLITPLKDEKQNNMLHFVGKQAKRKRLEDVSGVALQMQRELLWFKEVEGMIPSSYKERKNEDGLTPEELFTKEHKQLVTEGEKWMKDTASQCMVVAALIATIVFAAAFTVPVDTTKTMASQSSVQKQPLWCSLWQMPFPYLRHLLQF
ncbi:putative PGG domain, ankyrin repeat-containing domain superfamily [Helianthus annuus]|nr:putative PGG domain, ankyrin repeat-containing domain superfamily [Helianthus annuus]